MFWTVWRCCTCTPEKSAPKEAHTGSSHERTKPPKTLKEEQKGLAEQKALRVGDLARVPSMK